MADDPHVPEDEWLRIRIERLRDIRRAVFDLKTMQAIDELIAESEKRLETLSRR